MSRRRKIWIAVGVVFGLYLIGLIGAAIENESAYNGGAESDSQPTETTSAPRTEDDVKAQLRRAFMSPRTWDAMAIALVADSNTLGQVTQLNWNTDRDLIQLWLTSPYVNRQLHEVGAAEIIILISQLWASGEPFGPSAPSSAFTPGLDFNYESADEQIWFNTTCSAARMQKIGEVSARLVGASYATVGAALTAVGINPQTPCAGASA